MPDASLFSASGVDTVHSISSRSGVFIGEKAVGLSGDSCRPMECVGAIEPEIVPASLPSGIASNKGVPRLLDVVPDSCNV